MSNQQIDRKIPYIIWLALMSSITVIFYFANYGMPTSDAQPNDMFKYIFISMAGISAVVSYVFRGIARGKAQDVKLDDQQKLAQSYVFSIISWALCESVAIFGLVTIQLTGDKTVGNGLIATGLVLIGLFRPILPSNNNLRKSYTIENK